MRNGYPRLILLIALVLLLAAGQAPAEGFAAPVSAMAAKQAAYEVLLGRLEGEDTVRVIVRLSTPFQAEPLLPSRASVQAQQRAIAQAQQAVLQRLDAFQAAAARRYTHVPFLALEVDAAGLADLVANPAVLSIQEDIPARPSLSQSIPIIGADEVWAQGYTGQGQAVAILDTGVDSSHLFLTGSIIAEACFSGAFAPSTSLCPNGQTSQTGAGAGEDCSAGVLGCNHGTHVAGIAAGNGTTFDGVARDATILAVQVFSRFDSDSYCGVGNSPCALSWTADQISALEWVYDQRLVVADSIASINMSLGGSTPYTAPCDGDARKPIIDTLRSANIATVIASGNSGFTNGVSDPACISSAISVASTTDADAVSYFSNVGALLTFFAPGHTITSSVPGGGYATWGGTSMAAPHVAGAWALLRSYAPGATVDEIQIALEDSGLPVTDGRSGGTYTRPRILVDAAMGFLSIPPTSTATSTATRTATRTSTNTSTRTATATATNTATRTSTATPTNTATATASRTATATATNSATATNTFTPTIPVTASPTPTQTATPENTPTTTPTPIFADVPESHWAHGYIEALYNAGYVVGCQATPIRLYCPDRILSRAESAVFVERGEHGAIADPPYAPPATPTFVDVPPSYWGFGWIESLWADGFTAGCLLTPFSYCPERQHTRAEGSVFFLRIEYGAAYTPPPGTGIFADVLPGDWFYDWAEAAYNEGLLPACEADPLAYCPNSPLDRAWAAYMMVQAKGIPVP